MDKAKTGALIAAARKEKDMTQRELAAALHVSDRAVSKWERGAGFPDISLLEPLADALGLDVLDLLQGERGTEPEPELTVRQALAFLARAVPFQTTLADFTGNALVTLPGGTVMPAGLYPLAVLPLWLVALLPLAARGYLRRRM